jgi:hypothetical protein
MNAQITATANRQTYIREINAAWQMSLQSVLETGRLLIEAKKQLPHGDFEAMIRNDLQFSPQTARKIMSIAAHPVISNRAHVRDFPSSWGTLYELTKVPEQKLLAKISDGTINPKMERKQAVALLGKKSRASKTHTADKADDDDADDADDQGSQRDAAPKRHDATPQVMALYDAGKSNKEIADKTGLGKRQVRHIVDEERIRRDAVATFKPELTVDIDTLAPTAKEKLDAAIKQEKRKHDAEHATRMNGIDEEVRLRVVAESKDYVARLNEMEIKVRDEQKFWQHVANNHKPLFTVDQFKTVLMCLHPDGQRTADKLAEAFRLFKDKQVQLTGKRG